MQASEEKPTETDEVAALKALLSAHPRWSKGLHVSIAQALRCRKVSVKLKMTYIDIMAERYPSRFNFESYLG